MRGASVAQKQGARRRHVRSGRSVAAETRRGKVERQERRSASFLRRSRGELASVEARKSRAGQGTVERTVRAAASMHGGGRGERRASRPSLHGARLQQVRALLRVRARAGAVQHLRAPQRGDTSESERRSREANGRGRVGTASCASAPTSCRAARPHARHAPCTTRYDPHAPSSQVRLALLAAAGPHSAPSSRQHHHNRL